MNGRREAGAEEVAKGSMGPDSRALAVWASGGCPKLLSVVIQQEVTTETAAAHVPITSWFGIRPSVAGPVDGMGGKIEGGRAGGWGEKWRKGGREVGKECGREGRREM